LSDYSDRDGGGCQLEIVLIYLFIGSLHDSPIILHVKDIIGFACNSSQTLWSLAVFP